MISNETLMIKVNEQLDIQNMQDIKEILATPAGRRFFQWLVMRCGQNNTSFTRDSRTYFNEGMRNVALILEGCLKAMGLSGVDLLHSAEKEYIIYQESVKRDIINQHERSGK
jgi:hypothetical protein